ncbi:hypothetical protein STRDD10_01714 [Streptococcus sp. DD10]|uniref:ElyC/SanA/YdcF family protein n=1 Tax=Streptococcus sp. DD10 TaxID=1777878 RepID=UPI000797396F|nr:ElyC/SanA/YdcF family protein [Streptococcus sp. DD10]KXT72932.1 hypothetical protein STRDD10_01714 [Streptococcus sp. DD10]
MEILSSIQVLADFLGPRDLDQLSQSAVKAVLKKDQADLFVLFGGSILAGGDVLAQAIENRIAKHYIIVGGAGHTTASLREVMATVFPELPIENLPEAQLFQTYLDAKYGLAADYLECESTNCGNNITFLLDLLEEEEIKAQSIILCQDATMQRRMAATLARYAPGMTILNYASYEVEMKKKKDCLEFVQPALGMWELERYISLLLGEIPRLRDDEKGYGPLGQNYLAHVDLPSEVEQAFQRLSTCYPDLIRKADPRFATPD